MFNFFILCDKEEEKNFEDHTISHIVDELYNVFLHTSYLKKEGIQYIHILLGEGGIVSFHSYWHKDFFIEQGRGGVGVGEYIN